jgi:hypothetical protein
MTDIPTTTFIKMADGSEWFGRLPDVVRRYMAEMANEIARLREAQKPIPFSERMPEIGQRIMLWNRLESEWIVEDFWHDPKLTDLLRHHTHWLLMPPAPEATALTDADLYAAILAAARSHRRTTGLAKESLYLRYRRAVCALALDLSIVERDMQLRVELDY